MSTKKITTVGMLCAMAIVVNVLISFPLVPAVSFLKYDPKDIVILIGGFIYGPLISLIMSLITSIIEIIYRPGNVLDIIMNVISTCSFAMLASYVYKKNHTKKGAIIGMSLGIIGCIIVMLIWNYVIDPIYFGMEREAVVLMLPSIALFNFIKCAINMAVTIFLYKPLVTILRNTNLVEKSDQESTFSKEMIILALFILITIVVFCLSYNGII